MNRLLLAAVAATLAIISSSPAEAQYAMPPGPAVAYPAPAIAAAPMGAASCPQCGRIHGGSPSFFGRVFGLGNAAGYGPTPGSPFLTPSTYAPLADPTGRGGLPVNPYVGPNRLPRGQVYYGGRFFGTFNNRFYGPQYGYF